MKRTRKQAMNRRTLVAALAAVALLGTSAHAADAPATSADQRVNELKLDIPPPAGGNRMIAPAVRVGDEILGRVDPQRLEALLQQLRQEHTR